MRYEREADRKARQRRNLKVSLGVTGGLTVVSLLLTLFWNAAALAFFIAFGLVFSLLLNGGGKELWRDLRDEFKSAVMSNLPYKQNYRRMAGCLAMISAPFYFLWQISSLLLYVVENGFYMWGITSFPVLFLSATSMIPFKDWWKEIDDNSSLRFWLQQIGVYVLTLLIGFLVSYFGGWLAWRGVYGPVA